ncbi:MAG: PQQ-binding-like beta-propeller repeat protein [Gemmataceae bacterium]
MKRICLAFLASSFTMASARAENWPQWRGPQNNGHSSEKGLPTEWSADKNIKWSLKLPGSGSSTPCVWDKTIFLTSMSGNEVVFMAIGTDGKEQWRKVLGKGNIKTLGDEGGNLATASCSTDGKLVFVQVGSGKLAAFDFDGKEVWSVDLAEKYGDFTNGNVIQFGGHWTPVLHKGVLYCTVLDRKVQKVFALDAATGKELWAIDRKSDSKPGTESPDVYSSPFIWEKGDNSLLLVHGNDYCTAHSLKDGAELWRVGGLNPKDKYNRAWRSISSPLATPDLIVVPSCKKGVTVGVDPEKATGLIEAGSTGETWRIPKNTPDVSSPIKVDGIVYLMGEVGTLMAHDAKTGKELYSERITNMRHRANPVYADGNLYFVARDGLCEVVKPGTTFTKVAENKLNDTFTASPAISNGVIYLRGWKTLYAIAVK